MLWYVLVTLYVHHQILVPLTSTSQMLARAVHQAHLLGSVEVGMMYVVLVEISDL